MNATNDPVSTYGMEFLLHTITITIYIYIHTYIHTSKLQICFFEKNDEGHAPFVFWHCFWLLLGLDALTAPLPFWQVAAAQSNLQLCKALSGASSYLDSQAQGSEAPLFPSRM